MDFTLLSSVSGKFGTFLVYSKNIETGDAVKLAYKLGTADKTKELAL